MSVIDLDEILKSQRSVVSSAAPVDLFAMWTDHVKSGQKPPAAAATKSRAPTTQALAVIDSTPALATQPRTRTRSARASRSARKTAAGSLSLLGLATAVDTAGPPEDGLKELWEKAKTKARELRELLRKRLEEFRHRNDFHGTFNEHQDYMKRELAAVACKACATGNGTAAAYGTDPKPSAAHVRLATSVLQGLPLAYSNKDIITAVDAAVEKHAAALFPTAGGAAAGAGATLAATARTPTRATAATTAAARIPIVAAQPPRAGLSPTDIRSWTAMQKLRTGEKIAATNRKSGTDGVFIVDGVSPDGITCRSTMTNEVFTFTKEYFHSMVTGMGASLDVKRLP